MKSIVYNLLFFVSCTLALFTISPSLTTVIETPKNRAIIGCVSILNIQIVEFSNSNSPFSMEVLRCQNLGTLPNTKHSPP